MKKLVLLAITGIFLVSCGGWSSDDKEFAMWICEEEMGMDDDMCECFVEKLEEEYGSFQESWDVENELELKMMRAEYEEDDDLIKDLKKEAKELRDWYEEAREDCYDD